MAKRRRRRKKNDDGAAYGLAVFLFLAVMVVNQPQLLWVLIPLGCVAVFVALKARQRNRARTLALRELSALTPREFELHVARVIGALPGWRAEATRASADQGADVIVHGPNGVKVAVQVKHYTKNVGNAAVQEIVASKAFYRCTHAVVVTSGPGYTRAAHELARANRVPLWGPSDLFAIQAAAQKGEALPPRLLA